MLRTGCVPIDLQIWVAKADPESRIINAEMQDYRHDKAMVIVSASCPLELRMEIGARKAKAHLLRALQESGLATSSAPWP